MMLAFNFLNYRLVSASPTSLEKKHREFSSRMAFTAENCCGFTWACIGLNPKVNMLQGIARTHRMALDKSKKFYRK